MNSANVTRTNTIEIGPPSAQHETSSRRLPAEHEPQRAIAVTWPHAATDWRGQLDRIETCYVALSYAITRFQDILICVADSHLKSHITHVLTRAKIDLGRVSFAVVPYNDTWIRDYGPICVIDNDTPQVLDFQFNGWGERFDARLDNQVTTRLHKQGWFGDHRLEHIDWVLEGGAIDSDGLGSLLTTRRCLCNANRNEGTGPKQMGTLLHDWFGVHRVLWLEDGYLEGDDTDGHVDQLARFCGPDTIAYCAADASGDGQARALQRMEEQLQAIVRANGKHYQLAALPTPRPIVGRGGERLPASYANFLVINGAVLVPAYEDPADQVALTRLRKHFPRHRLIQIPARALLEQGGSVHCATMQLPSGVFTISNGTIPA